MIRFCEETLAQIDENTVVIPGHGPVTDIARLGQYLVMLRAVRDRIQGMIDEGKNLEDITAAAPTADFRCHLRPGISFTGIREPRLH